MKPSPRPDETVSTDRSDYPRTVARGARLMFVWPRELAAIHPLGEADVLIGRQAPAEGVISAMHSTVSRQHAVIRWDPVAERHAVADLGSRNGVALQGQQVSALPRYVEDGAVLRIGDVLAVYERLDAAAVDAPEVSRREIPGESQAVGALRAAIARASADPSPVLVLGETGAGKERIAGELHRLSGRRGPLIAVNCATLSPQLIESELFGHVRGAFTGATREHAGLFREASGGTLFLDELGELPLDLQPKLLRAVELGEVSPVGSVQRYKVDVRLVAATNRSLFDEVERGRFRRDLYARLALWEIHVPPLRARRSDLLGWIDRLHRGWGEHRGQAEVRPLDFSPEAVERLLLADWTENLRGLQRCVHELASAAHARPITPLDLPAWLRQRSAAAPAQSTEPALKDRLLRQRPSRDEVMAALIANNWSIRATAKHFDRDRKQISRWIEYYAIERPDRGDD
ncbi:DNA-binding transcriptional response regulator, NtrC family, contains REC, AAA-type ATPase, and a Fis-type DNA-binding domains [Nannocystis exedens]|uniref:DNA-binding transcriptional response regulator, NtrC family, contains REC, AAA-type ATPase, and a Fis-type DNA-binding domains n=1 Tax=Nannocystis exedens TaxID=54 RepID=A0A1I1YV94_9BACT|nr:sigma 54-interacting transcriptional regulator [Nannocystis exedens]PCC70194.1 sigma-54-dependent Fis family transcriptional regulator [Nannocystis exedens]SFE22063.1 DNA-binding transcriptional response regulator, NtrC family, contains REC, AAA-type ATPase, and a Fis-type DNA-binding domains [Nannocystis exedens]